MRHSELYLKAQALQNTLIACATSDELEAGDYGQLRSELMSYSQFKGLVPEFVITCRSLNHFWAFIKTKFAHYAERRDFIWSSFTPLLDAIELVDTNPVDAIAGSSIEKTGQDYIANQWNKCLERRSTDPEAAITSARSLLETVLKYALDERDLEYKESDDLPTLYRKVAGALNLAPEQHNENVFKQILGGMASVVNGFASLRNKYGDAHGKQKKYVRPSSRHAQLAVNLSGTISTFLFETLQRVTENEDTADK